LGAGEPQNSPGSGSPWKADLALLLITAAWGTTFVVVKDALAHADALSFLALRFGLGALVCTALAWRARFDVPLLRRGLLLGLFLFAGYVLQTFGLLYTTPSRSAFITSLAVLLVPIASVAVFRRWPSWPATLGVLLAMAGMYVLTGGLAADPGAQVLRGDLLTLGCAVCYALHITYTEKFAVQTRSPAALVAVQLWIVALLCAACLPFAGAQVRWTGALWGAVLFTGVFATALAIVIQTWAQARTAAVRAALIFSLEPIFAAALAVALGMEVLGASELGGGALLLLAVLVSELGAAYLARRRRLAL
jgi:drug/metabolite transporter (DMT)-like permease